MTYKIYQEDPEDDYAVSCLVARIFGPGRFTKSAYRYRDMQDHISELAFVVKNHLGRIVGTIRCWHMDHIAHDILLGPIAVDGDLRNMGLGINLMEASLEKANLLGYKRVILVGDIEYYNKFGFAHPKQGKITFAGPVKQNRLLEKWLL
ncbi:MAG: N-acetyltransferase [Pseudomonadota bacterium]